MALLVQTLEKLGTAPLAQLVNKYADPVDSAETFITQLKAINRETGAPLPISLCFHPSHPAVI